MNYENYDPCFPDQPVVDQYLPVWASLPSFQSKAAFIWAKDGPRGLAEASSLTYRELNNSVQAISSKLLLTLKRGDTVVILCSPGLELVEIIFGCQRAGLLSIPISPPNASFTNNDYHHLVRVLSQTQPKAAIASSHYIKNVQQYVEQSRTNKQLSDLLKKLTWISTENMCDSMINCSLSSYHGCKPNEVYLIQYTSGATGIPKPVLVTAGSAAHNVRIARKAYDLHPNSIITSWLPQYHDCGLMFLMLTIVSGATCVLTSPRAFVKRPRLWLESITEFKATCTPVPSFTLPLVVKRGEVNKGSLPINLQSMKNLIIINEPIYKEAIEEFVEVFRPFGLNPSSIAPSYGLAENCTFVSTAWTSETSNCRNFPTHKKLLPSARLGFGDDEDISIIIVNEETCELVEDGVEGEIWISSPSNASGYLGHPSLTQNVFQARVSKITSHCFVRTGDRGIVKGEERYLFVTGRSSDVIKLQNSKEMHPHYIETAAYNSCQQLLRGGCISAFTISSKTELETVAVVAEMQRSGAEVRTMREICEGIRRAVKREEGINIGLVVLVKSGNIPKTTSGKIQRWAAKQKFLWAEMEVLMQMEFNNTDYNSKSPGKIERKDKRKVIINEDTEGAYLAQSNSPIYPSFLSSL